MAYADQQMSGNRIVAIIIGALIHVALGYALITGLAYSAVKKAIATGSTADDSVRWWASDQDATAIPIDAATLEAFDKDGFFTIDPLLDPEEVKFRRLELPPEDAHADDAADVFALYSDPEVCRYWSFAPWTTLAQAEAWLAERIDSLGGELRLEPAEPSGGEAHHQPLERPGAHPLGARERHGGLRRTRRADE